LLPSFKGELESENHHRHQPHCHPDGIRCRHLPPRTHGIGGPDALRGMRGAGEVGLDEPTLKQHINKILTPDFRLAPEVSGKHLIDGEPVRIDYLAYPLPHLTSRGFDPIVFGIEAKEIGGYGRSKIFKLLWQTISYTQSLFSINGQQHRPAFVLMCVDGTPHDEMLWTGLIQFAQYANVGLLEFPRYHGWRIRFGGGGYYSKRNGRSNIKNLGTIHYVGSIN
jgi:hypothetical protein